MTHLELWILKKFSSFGRNYNNFLISYLLAQNRADSRVAEHNRKTNAVVLVKSKQGDFLRQMTEILKIRISF